MSFALGFLSSVILIALWGWFYYNRDPHPEKIKHILTATGFGVIAFFFTFILLVPISWLFDTSFESIDVFFYNAHILTVILLAAAEEFSKLFVLRYIIFKIRAVDEHIDGVLYGGLVGLGFAAIENFFYALELDLTSAIVRALLIPLLHSATGAILGFFIIEKKLKDTPAHQHSIWLALGITTLFHGLYNYFLIVTEVFPLAILLVLLMWVGLLVAVGYVTNLSRNRDYHQHHHTLAEDTNEAREEGKTYCLLGLFCSLLALLLIFPIFLGPLGYFLGMVGTQQGAVVWGLRTKRFAVAATLVGFLANTIFQTI